MKLSNKYFLIDLSINPRAKWALIFLGITGLLVIIDVITNDFWENEIISPSNLAYFFLGFSAVECFRYIKLREHELAMDRERKLRAEDLTCPYCKEQFIFVQEYNIHLKQERRIRIESNN